MAKIMLAVPKRFAAREEMPRVLSQPADLYIFPEGFLRSAEEVSMALTLTCGREVTVIAGFRDGDREKVLALENGQIADSYTKCVLTQTEKEKGKLPGGEIRCLNTQFGKIAVPICYELHFPEVCRCMALEDPVLMVNPIGTGMYHSLQYEQWRALAKARAIENELPVAGCSHFCGEIPLAFVFNSAGGEVLAVQGARGCFAAAIDLSESGKRPIGYFRDRISVQL